MPPRHAREIGRLCNPPPLTHGRASIAKLSIRRAESKLPDAEYYWPTRAGTWPWRAWKSPCLSAQTSPREIARDRARSRPPRPTRPIRQAGVSGDVRHAVRVYERCLVPCCMYNELWLRYVDFLLAKQMLPEARAVFTRASGVFLKRRVEILLAHSAFEEDQADTDLAAARRLLDAAGEPSDRRLIAV